MRSDFPDFLENEKWNKVFRNRFHFFVNKMLTCFSDLHLLYFFFYSKLIPLIVYTIFSCLLIRDWFSWSDYLRKTIIFILFLYFSFFPNAIQNFFDNFVIGIIKTKIFTRFTFEKPYLLLLYTFEFSFLPSSEAQANTDEKSKQK